jgi:hypothetical protein
MTRNYREAAPGTSVQNFFSLTPVPSRLFLPDGEDYAFFLAPVADDFRQYLAAKTIPFFPQVVGCDLILEAAKRMIAVDHSKQTPPNLISPYLMAKIGHDVPFMHVEGSRETQIAVCGFNEHSQFGFFLLPIWKQIDLLWFRFTERERFVGDQQNFAGLAIEKGKQGVGLRFKGID